MIAENVTARPRQFTPLSIAIVLGLVALIAIGLQIYAQTRAFAWDEGWHLLAAQNINRGKNIYLDFCYPQTPLNAYWNAAWMRLFGDNWHVPHAVSAVTASLAILFMSGYLFLRFPERNWRPAAAITAAFLFGLNIVVVEFGTIAQSYGNCLFLIVTAFLFTVRGVERRGPAFAAAAGLLACTAVNCSLLTAPVAPVLFIWIFFCNRQGNRWAKLGAFVLAGSLAFIPLAWLYMHGPKQTIFNVLQYNMLYRTRKWEGWREHNFAEWFAWVSSPQALLLAGLTWAGLLFIRKRSGWDRTDRREYYLCIWLALALIAHVSSATPTFRRYYLLAVPFLAMVSCAGLYDVGTRLGSPRRPWTPVAIVCVLTAACLAKSIIEGSKDFTWFTVEEIAAKVKQVTPPKAMLLADEPTYFVTRREPPAGLELADSHKLQFPPDVERRLHVMSAAELDQKIKGGTFDVIEISDDDERVDRLNIAKMYVHQDKLVGDDYDVFWGRRIPPPAK